MALIRQLRSLGGLERPGLVGLMSFSHGFNEFFSTILPPLFPFLLPSLDITYSDASLLIAVFFTSYAVVQLPVGPLADRYSSRRILAVGMGTLALGMMILAVVSTYPLMLVGMVVAGIGGATYHPTGMGLISDVESDATYGRSMGIHGALGSLGTVIAPLLVVGVAKLAGWRTAVIIGSLTGFVFAFVLYVTYPLVAPDRFVDGSPNLVVALKRTFSEDWNPREVLTYARTYLTEPRSLLLILLFLVIGGEIRAAQTFVASFSIAKTGLQESYGGTMLSLMMLAAGFSAVVSGSLVDRIDKDVFAAATFLGTSVIVVAIVVTPLGPAALAGSFLVFGAVLYSIYPAANSIVSETSVTENSSALFSITNTASRVGGAIGAYILGVVADLISVQSAFALIAGIATIGAVAAISYKHLG